jgi:hypothetical protein
MSRGDREIKQRRGRKIREWRVKAVIPTRKSCIRHCKVFTALYAVKPLMKINTRSTA